jgi:hypothetical protein
MLDVVICVFTVCTLFGGVGGNNTFTVAVEL